MAFTRGTRLGTHGIISQIGVGMGEVYRATDSNLKRQVAVKVLPASVAADAARLAHFQREAEVLAALNPSTFVAAHVAGPCVWLRRNVRRHVCSAHSVRAL